jgi:spore coat protein JB
MSKELPEKYYTLLHELQALDFVLVELTLYLDTHPQDQQAIQQFNQFTQQRMQVAHQFQLEFGPLTQYGHSFGFSKHPWQWSEGPWPWQV